MLNYCCSYAGNAAKEVAYFPIKVVGNACLFAAQSFFSAISLASFGYCTAADTSLKQGSRLSNSFSDLTILPYETALKILNPAFQPIDDKKSLVYRGLTCYRVLNQFDSAILNKCLSSKSLFHRQISARVASAARIVLAVVSRAFDGVVGTLVFVPALIYLGRDDTLNTYTIVHAKSFGKIVGDIYCGAMGILNPNALART